MQGKQYGKLICLGIEMERIPVNYLKITNKHMSRVWDSWGTVRGCKSRSQKLLRIILTYVHV